jgi:hypothetical protein
VPGDRVKAGEDCEGTPATNDGAHVVGSLNRHEQSRVMTPWNVHGVPPSGPLSWQLRGSTLANGAQIRLIRPVTTNTWTNPG